MGWSLHPPGAGTHPQSRHPPARSPSSSPLGVGMDQMPLNFPLGCGPGNLQGMLGYHPIPWRPAERHAGIPPAMHAGITPPSPLWTEFLTHASENITLPQTSFAGGNKI